MAGQSKSSPRLLLVTGMSGAGKSTVLDALEDMGWDCVDNLPTALLKDFVHGESDGRQKMPVAVGMDVRSRGFEIAFARPRRASAIVMGEPGRLARAIDNIIDNAISFSPPGGLVEVAATHVGDEIRIRIEDEGPGVPTEQREAIFNRFHSVRPNAESFGRHSGLGLAIARAIVEGHDGVIDVTDRDDAPSGARFTITLKAADRA